VKLNYRKWLIAALVGIVAPLLIDQRWLQSDHVCSAVEQIQAEAWEARVRNSRIDELVPPGPDCVTREQSTYLASHLPEAAESMVLFSFVISVMSLFLFGFFLWPMACGVARLVSVVSQSIQRRGVRTR
jgi:hypothetical protein